MTQQLYDAVSKDIKQVLIQFLAVRGHGKSSSLRTIINEVKKSHPDIIFKIFDVSQAWYHCAPVAHRQVVSKVTVKRIRNIGDCVYEMGFLTSDERRLFVASIVNADYVTRQTQKFSDPEGFKRVPWIIYVFEEADVYFGSYSFRAKDWASPILKDFVSVGRNYNMGAFLVATAETGEIAPPLRRRSSRIYGRVEAEGDLNRLKRKSKEVWAQVKSMPRYHFLYYGENPVGPYRIPDTVDWVPETYEPPHRTRVRVEGEMGWGSKAAIGFIVTAFLLLAIAKIFL